MPDATGLIFQENVGSNAEIWVLPLVGDGEAASLTAIRSGNKAQPSLSPDGRWIAYHSDVSGGTTKKFCSTVPGAWRPRSKFRSMEAVARSGRRPAVRSSTQDDNSRSMMVVAIRTEPELEVGPPQRLFEWPEYELASPVGHHPRRTTFRGRATDRHDGSARKSTSSSTGSKSSSVSLRQTERSLFEPSKTLFDRMHNKRPETFTRLVGHVNEPNAHPATNTCLGDTPFRTPNHFRV